MQNKHQQLILFVASIIGVVALQTFAGYHFARSVTSIETGFFFFATTSVFITTLIVVIFKSLTRRKARYVVTALILILVSGLGFHAQTRYIDYLNIQSQNNGELILSAIKQYQSNQGLLPSNLSALTPVFLQKIPKPAFQGGYFMYYIIDKYEFQIAYHLPVGMIYTRSSNSSNWIHHD